MCAKLEDPRVLIHRASIRDDPGVLAIACGIYLGALERIDLVRSGRIVRTFAGTGAREMRLEESIAGLEGGEYLYVRAVLVDGGAAWSSPFFVD